MSNNFNSKDYTFVSACKNRLYNLKKTLETWANENPFQIIIIDWGSDLKIKKDDFNPEFAPIIKIIRYESDNWILSWAFNEGLSKVQTKYTVKLDCDHFLRKGFLENNQCSTNSFIKSNQRSITGDQVHLNGAFISCTELLRNVGFFNERITTYGWEDSELFLRLFNQADKHLKLDKSYIKHIKQTEESRTSNQQVSIEKILSDHLNCKLSFFLIKKNQNLVKLYNDEWDKITFENGFERKEIEENKRSHNLYNDIATFQTFIALKDDLNYKMYGKSLKTKDIINEYYELLYKHNPDKYIPINLLVPELIERYLLANQINDVILQNIINYSLNLLFNDKDLVNNNLVRLSEIIVYTKEQKDKDAFVNKHQLEIDKATHLIKIKLMQREIAKLLKEKTQYSDLSKKFVSTINRLNLIIDNLIQENILMKKRFNGEISYAKYFKRDRGKLPSLKVQSLLANYFLALKKSIDLLKKYSNY
tara:strand:+ start:1204 stop:2634 length:1431 start_codon:yes stop_codon:yes gene_type:complete